MSYGIIIVHVIVIAVIGSIWLHIRVYEILNNKKYVEKVGRTTTLDNIPRNSIDGYISRLLHAIKYLKNHEYVELDDDFVHSYDFTIHSKIAQKSLDFRMKLFFCIFRHIIIGWSYKLLLIIGAIGTFLSFAIPEIWTKCRSHVFSFEIDKLMDCIARHL